MKKQAMNKYIDSVLTLMEKKENIRNISIVSHVDHGKTTLSDHLLQAGGLISRTMAGKARVLDYLEEEQKRGITIKTANISFKYKYNDEDYLINLVDTPGHIDFSAAVSQALRLVDGVIIIVDAVEQVMAQTESVIIQSMREGLRPILYINKVDRLITELKLNKKDIKSRITHIIQLINELIDQYKPEGITEDWRLRIDKGTVIIGSALHGWAISKYCLPLPKFDEIIDAYNSSKVEDLAETFPVSRSVLHSVIENIPSPKQAQKNRIRHITTKLSTNCLNVVSKCNDNNPIVSCVGKLLYDENRGIITVIRLFSGTIKHGTQLLNLRTNKLLKVNQVCIYKGEKLITVPFISAGNIGVLIGLEDVIISDTLVENKLSNEILFSSIAYIQEAVITRRIEPKNISDIPLLTKKLDIFSKTKPNFYYSIDEQTGEIRIYGIGELQLEIIINEIRESGIEVEFSDPEVTLVEQIESDTEVTETDPLHRLKVKIACKKVADCPKEALIKNKYNNCLVSRIPTKDSELFDLVKIGFQNAILRGPNNYPLKNIMVELEDLTELQPDSLRYEIIVPTISSAIKKAIVKAGVSVYEPVYQFEITTPPHYLGAVLNVIQKFRGSVEEILEFKLRYRIIGQISVASSLNIAPELRSASEGFAFWQFKFVGYKKKDTIQIM